jgi:hypothetical protein
LVAAGRFSAILIAALSVAIVTAGVTAELLLRSAPAKPVSAVDTIFIAQETGTNYTPGQWSFTVAFLFLANGSTTSMMQFYAVPNPPNASVGFAVQVTGTTGSLIAEFNSTGSCWRAELPGCTGPFVSMGGWVVGNGTMVSASDHLTVLSASNLSAYPFFIGMEYTPPPSGPWYQTAQVRL